METNQQPPNQPPVQPERNWFDTKHILTYVFVLITLGAIGYGLYVYLTPTVSQQQTQTEMADWKTYTNSKYGFELKIPQTYQLYEPLMLVNGEYVFPSANKKWNDEVTSPSVVMFTSVVPYDEAPKTIQEACRKAESEMGDAYDSQGKLLPKDSCHIHRQTSQEELQTMMDDLDKAKIGSAFTIYGSTGEVVALGDKKGVLKAEASKQAVGSNITLEWFDEETKDLINLNQSLAAPTTAEARNSNEYRTTRQIISTFKFIK